MINSNLMNNNMYQIDKNIYKPDKNTYQVDRINSSALLSIIVSLFYYKNSCVYLCKNYNSNTIIYLQQYLNHILSYLRNFDDNKKQVEQLITLSNVDYIVELLKNSDFPIRSNATKVQQFKQNRSNNSTPIISNVANNSNIIKDLCVSIMKLFEINNQIFDVLIKSNVLDNSLYFTFLVSEERNIIDLFNEMYRDKLRSNVNDLNYLIFYIKKDRTTKINIQKRIIIENNFKKISSNYNSHDSCIEESSSNNCIDGKKIKFRFRSVVCYSMSKCLYYTVIKILSSYYLYDTFNNEQIRKIKISSLSEVIKNECIMIIYKK